MYDLMYSYSMMQALVEVIDRMMFETILRMNRLHNKLTMMMRMKMTLMKIGELIGYIRHSEDDQHEMPSVDLDTIA